MATIQGWLLYKDDDYISMYVCTYVHTYVVCMYVCIHVCIHVRTYVCMCMDECMHSTTQRQHCLLFHSIKHTRFKLIKQLVVACVNSNSLVLYAQWLYHKTRKCLNLCNLSEAAQST